MSTHRDTVSDLRFFVQLMKIVHTHLPLWIIETSDSRYVSALMTCMFQSIDCMCIVLLHIVNTISLILIKGDTNNLEYRIFHTFICPLDSHCTAAEVFYDLTTLSNTELEHAQSHQHAKRWVWSITHRHIEQKMHDL